jgi:hypothetical protein
MATFGGKGEIHMDKAKDRGNVDSQKSLKDEVDQALKDPGTGRRDPRVWVREDGAVCFGDCVTIKPDSTGALNLTIDPSSCGSEAGEVILEHLIKTAGKGVNVVIPPQQRTMDVTTHTKYPGKPGTTQVEHLPKPK